MGDHEVCITWRKKKEGRREAGRGGRTAREVRDWHPNLDSSVVAHSVDSYLGMKFSRLERN